MSEESLDHHEVDVARLGRVRLPRFRSVASVTTVGLLLGAAAVPVLADSSRSATAPSAATCPPWLCPPDGGGGHNPTLPPATASSPAEPDAPSAPPGGATPSPAEPAPGAEVSLPDTAPLPEPRPDEVGEVAAPSPADEPAPSTAGEWSAPRPAWESAPSPAEESAPTTAEETAPTTTEETAPTTAEETAPTAAEESSPATTTTNPSSATPATERGSRVSFEAYAGWGLGMSYTSNGTNSALSVEVGYGRDAAWSFDPDAEMPTPGPYAEASATVSVPGTTVGGRTTVTIDQRGPRMDNTYNSRNTRTGTSVGPDGVEAPDSRWGGSIPGGTRYGPVGAHVSVGYTVDDPFGPPSKPAGEYDSDVDGFKDGDMAESPEVGGRWGQNPAHTAPSAGDTDADGTPDASDITIGKDSDEDTVPDDIDQRPGEVDVDVDADAVADQVDNDIGPADSDRDGDPDGSMAESPEIGGGSRDTDPSDPDVDADSDGDGLSDGSMAESPEIGGGSRDTDPSDSGSGGGESGASDSGTSSSGSAGAGASGSDSSGSDSSGSSASSAGAGASGSGSSGSSSSSASSTGDVDGDGSPDASDADVDGGGPGGV